MGIEYTETEKGYLIRLRNEHGFTWFETDTKLGRILKIKRAKEILLYHISEYAFVNPIKI